MLLSPRCDFTSSIPSESSLSHSSPFIRERRLFQPVIEQQDCPHHRGIIGDAVESQRHLKAWQVQRQL